VTDKPIRNASDAVQLAEFEQGFIAAVSEIVICVSQIKWGFTHHELVDPETATKRTVRVIVI
jgi:hypothetical protein